MKTATVADLRNRFRRIASWIEHGETVRILKRGRPFAQLSALSNPRRESAVPKPDIMAQLRGIWGHRVLSTKKVRSMRAAELEGDDG